MPLWSCEQCGAQFPETASPPASCPICEDERQYVNWKGQQWLTREALAERHRIVWRDDLGLTGLGLDPGFAIGQRALLIQEPDGCVMWDCIPLATREAVEHVRSLGGLKAIAVSHPHYYGAVADWSEAFGGVPVYLHGDDRQWVTRPHPSIVPWTGDSRPISDDITLVRTGGHFAGGTILHWRAGRGRAGRAADRRRRDGGDGPPFAEFHVQLSELHSPECEGGAGHRACGSAAGVRPHLWRVVGQEHRGRRQGRVRCLGSAISGRDLGLGRPGAEGTPAPSLPPQMASLYQGFPIHALISRAPDDHHDCPRIPAVPGRGRRTPASDGALGLFGNRHFPARTDFERVGRLRQAAL